MSESHLFQENSLLLECFAIDRTIIAADNVIRSEEVTAGFLVSPSDLGYFTEVIAEDVRDGEANWCLLMGLLVMCVLHRQFFLLYCS